MTLSQERERTGRESTRSCCVAEFLAPLREASPSFLSAFPFPPLHPEERRGLQINAVTSGEHFSVPSVETSFQCKL